MKQTEQTNHISNSYSKKERNLSTGQVSTDSTSLGKIEYFISDDHYNSVKTNDEFISAYLFNGSIRVEKTEVKDINFKTICHIDPRSVKGFGISTDHKFLILELI